MQNLKSVLAAALIFGGGQSCSQDVSAEETPMPNQEDLCDAELEALRADHESASARISQLEMELDGAGTLTNNLSGQVRKAQLIIRDLVTQRDKLEEELSGSAVRQCPVSNSNEECAATASEVNELRAQVTACTAGADPNDALLSRIDELRAQVVAITAERDTLQTYIDGSQEMLRHGDTGSKVSEVIVNLRQQVEILTVQEGELTAELSDALEAVRTMTVERDRALESATEAQIALSEAVEDRNAAQEELDLAEARMSELRATAATAIGASSGALTVCENSPVKGGVILADEAAARSFKAGLGVLGEDMTVLVSPVPAIGAVCALQPVAGLLAPASELGKAYAVDYGTLSPDVVSALPRSVDCEALLETTAVQDVMAEAIGFGSAKRALWVQDAGGPKLCGSRNGQTGLLYSEPRNQSAVFFLTVHAF